MTRKPLLQLSIYENDDYGEIHLQGNRGISITGYLKCLKAFEIVAKEMMPEKIIYHTGELKCDDDQV